MNNKGYNMDIANKLYLTSISLSCVFLWEMFFLYFLSLQ